MWILVELNKLSTERFEWTWFRADNIDQRLFRCTNRFRIQLRKFIFDIECRTIDNRITIFIPLENQTKQEIEPRQWRQSRWLTGIYSQSDLRLWLIEEIAERRKSFFDSIRVWHWDWVSIDEQCCNVWQTCLEFYWKKSIFLIKKTRKSFDLFTNFAVILSRFVLNWVAVCKHWKHSKFKQRFY